MARPSSSYSPSQSSRTAPDGETVHAQFALGSCPLLTPMRDAALLSYNYSLHAARNPPPLASQITMRYATVSLIIVNVAAIVPALVCVVLAIRSSFSTLMQRQSSVYQSRPAMKPASTSMLVALMMSLSSVRSETTVPSVVHARPGHSLTSRQRRAPCGGRSTILSCAS